MTTCAGTTNFPVHGKPTVTHIQTAQARFDAAFEAFQNFEQGYGGPVLRDKLQRDMMQALDALDAARKTRPSSKPVRSKSWRRTRRKSD